jgi:hypothetical protein
MSLELKRSSILLEEELAQASSMVPLMPKKYCEPKKTQCGSFCHERSSGH